MTKPGRTMAAQAPSLKKWNQRRHLRIMAQPYGVFEDYCHPVAVESNSVWVPPHGLSIYPNVIWFVPDIDDTSFHTHDVPDDFRSISCHVFPQE